LLNSWIKLVVWYCKFISDSCFHEFCFKIEISGSNPYSLIFMGLGKKMKEWFGGLKAELTNHFAVDRLANALGFSLRWANELTNSMACRQARTWNLLMWLVCHHGHDSRTWIAAHPIVHLHQVAFVVIFWKNRFKKIINYRFL
jgi:hypothetical protein